MARPKHVDPMLDVARDYIAQNMPDLAEAPLHVRQLDGPPDGPRFAATAEVCVGGLCPHGVAPETAAAGACPVHECALRQAARLLINREGQVVAATRNHIHWYWPRR